MQTGSGAARVHTDAATTADDGDMIEATVATDDLAIELGTQRTVVRYA